MRKITTFLLAAATITFFSLIGCTKNNNTTTKTPDSVYTSSWITLDMNFNNVDSDWEQKIVAPAITSSIINNGVVLGYGAYLDQNNDTVIEQAIEFDMYQTFKVDSIFLQAGFNNSNLWYRYVVIPGHVLTTQGLTPIQARSLSYAELTKVVSAARKAEPPTLP